MATGFDPHVAATSIEKLAGGVRESMRDELAVEEPLEIRVDGEPLAVTMRTPGEDEELAAGFLAGEGLIGAPEDIVEVGPTRDFAANTVEVRTKNGLRRNPKDERSFYLTSSCGVCGKGALEFVRVQAPPPAGPPPATLSAELVLKSPDAVRAQQSAFDRTGGLHATGLFETDGTLLVVREDVGRHNAMDKAIGSLLLSGRFPLEGVFAAVSGRASFELVQKASLASLLGLIAVGPPSTLAVDLARERGMLLCGFVRGGSLNVYAGSDLLLVT
jgi:FdhD protein